MDEKKLTIPPYDSVPLVVLFAFHQSHFEVVWRLCLAIGAVLPLSIFYFRLKMISNTQYEKHALRANVPYKLIFKRCKSLLEQTGSMWR